MGSPHLCCCLKLKKQQVKLLNTRGTFNLFNMKPFQNEGWKWILNGPFIICRLIHGQFPCSLTLSCWNLVNNEKECNLLSRWQWSWPVKRGKNFPSAKKRNKSSLNCTESVIKWSGGDPQWLLVKSLVIRDRETLNADDYFADGIH